MLTRLQTALNARKLQTIALKQFSNATDPIK